MKNVNPILTHLVEELIVERPDDVLGFMAEFTSKAKKALKKARKKGEEMSDEDAALKIQNQMRVKQAKKKVDKKRKEMKK